MAQKISSQILEIARASAEGQEPKSTEEPSLGKLEEPADAGTAGEDSPPVPEEQDGVEMVDEESVPSEVEENTSVAELLMRSLTNRILFPARRLQEMR
jgi:hypothetical protein